MEVLKIATAGSVDDGKSTLIGRLLYDTQSLTTDKLEAIERSSKQKGYDYLDFSLATDGLVAEREQGITIDVAHIYFSTAKKSYIIADTPGHVEYTRNMVTGASTSQVSIILIDARKGVIEQTYRHFFINNLLRVKDVIVAINKMDLVDYSEEVFNKIKADFQALNAKSSYKEQNVSYIPLSALTGDNVVESLGKMPWYTGQTILQHLEALESKDIYDNGKTRFPVQTVIRPKTEEYHDFRGYAGKLNGNNIKVGDAVTVLPSLTESVVTKIHFFDKQYDEAVAGSSITIELENDINVTRGDMIVKSNELPKIEKEITTTVCWMDSKKLVAGTKYLVQHNTNRVLAKVDSINNVIATDYSGTTPASQLAINEIGEVTIKLSKALYFDTYEENKSNGAFILIDPNTNTTAGVGFIR
ncbi:sulfate adenylyltransferase subunit 1 [Flavobacterium glycines]|uniref:sulfate adenylyltransferase n=1 Tax=Flavobacterium glycines TaxID=551990 RepID=A0A1B9DN34_9FLAO|nr:GTP-binding protein [Flavobacterium glycines]OCB71085.1 sulfate adenylyltransferase [Flavobacterium glycines]GEL10901.1 sulfate adenylyltransferase subunit 1 [Flavobacterium glycines]SDI49538.1 sulfate adenylyltransferase subunit 1 [Flavobacterium glycines]